MNKTKTPKVDFAKRAAARLLLVQILYSMEFSDVSVETLKSNLLEINDNENCDWQYFDDCLQGIVNNMVAIDKHYATYASRHVQNMDVIEKSILRLATYELQHRLDVPHKVVLNEAINLAKDLGHPDSHKFVNSILDRIAIELRAVERQL